uniref:PWWP domain-containing protein n=1 Tax=Mesocestoides corti TaxID=53468 RepID=A0A5K3FHH6_MESCO
MSFRHFSECFNVKLNMDTDAAAFSLVDQKPVNLTGIETSVNVKIKLEEVESSSTPQVPPLRVGWDGEIWTIMSSDSEDSLFWISSPSSDVERPDNASEEVVRSQGASKKRLFSLTPDDDDFDDNDQSARSDAYHQQKLAKAIASKYRFGGCMRTSVNAASKQRVVLSKLRVSATSLLPGALVWALLPQKYQVPWWAGIIAGRPIKRRSKDSTEVCYYRVVLVCPPHQLTPECSPLVSQKNLRPFLGRAAFEAFMRSVLGNAKNKGQALAQFCIPPRYEDNWHAARDQVEAASNIPVKSLHARFRFLGIDLPRLQVKWKFDDKKRKEQLAKLKGSVGASNRETPEYIFPFKRKRPEPTKQYAVPAKYHPRTLPKDDVFAFEVLTSQTQVQQTRARFICCVCLKPGQLLAKNKKPDETAGGKAASAAATKPKPRVSATLLKRL